jgi:hypothetical protein
MKIPSSLQCATRSANASLLLLGDHSGFVFQALAVVSVD